MHSRKILLSISIAAAVAVIAACGSSNNNSTSTTAAVSTQDALKTATPIKHLVVIFG
jgi:phospholipase C